MVVLLVWVKSLRASRSQALSGPANSFSRSRERNVTEPAASDLKISMSTSSRSRCSGESIDNS